MAMRQWHHLTHSLIHDTYHEGRIGDALRPHELSIRGTIALQGSTLEVKRLIWLWTPRDALPVTRCSWP